jgi:hypothetical protein
MDTPHTVTLHETAQGAIFTMPGPITTSASGVSVFETFSVGNTGNQSAGFTLTVVTTQGPTNTFTSNLLSGTLAPQTTAPGTLTCVGPDSDAFEQFLGTMTLTPASGAVLCGDVPPATELSVSN